MAGSAQAPALEVNSLRGEPVTLSAYRGSVVLVNFWATWCPPCLVEMPAMQRLKERLDGRPFVILAVNAGESEAKLWQTRQRLGLDYPLLLDRERVAAEAWGVDVFPTSFLIDTQGRIAHRFVGMLDWNSPEAVELIEALMPPSGVGR